MPPSPPPLLSYFHVRTGGGCVRIILHHLQSLQSFSLSHYPQPSHTLGRSLYQHTLRIMLVANDDGVLLNQTRAQRDIRGWAVVVALTPGGDVKDDRSLASLAPMSCTFCHDRTRDGQYNSPFLSATVSAVLVVVVSEVGETERRSTKAWGPSAPSLYMRRSRMGSNRPG